MALWQLDIVGGVLLADGREVKMVSGIAPPRGPPAPTPYRSEAAVTISPPRTHVPTTTCSRTTSPEMATRWRSSCTVTSDCCCGSFGTCRGSSRTRGRGAGSVASRHARGRLLLRSSESLTWLHRIAVSEAISASRRRQGNNSTPIGEIYESEQLADPTDAVLGVEDREHAAAVMPELLALLPREQRLALEVLHLDGLSITEAAELLGVAVVVERSTITSRPSKPDHSAATRRRHGISGEKPWPSLGRLRVRLWGDQIRWPWLGRMPWPPTPGDEYMH